MTPRRLDRLAIRARLSALPDWIVEDLLDAFEPAALSAMAEFEARRKTASKSRDGARRARRRPDHSEAEDEA